MNKLDKLNKPAFAAMLAVTLLAVSGCDSKVPGDAIASKSVMEYARQNECTLTDTKIVDFKRGNGWADQQNPHQYDVRYDYNLQLTKPLAEAVLDAAKRYQQALAASNSAMSAADTNTVANWFNAQGEQLKARAQAFLQGCAECEQYLSDGHDDNRLAFALMWQAYENCGFPDAAKAGSKIVRYAWVGFTKTEQGWMPVDRLATNTGVVPGQIATNAPVDSAPAAAAMQINPANGLPMVPNAGVDVQGNPYGTGAPSPVNPANGQPMVPGTMVDVQGNAFGTSPMQ